MLSKRKVIVADTGPRLTGPALQDKEKRWGKEKWTESGSPVAEPLCSLRPQAASVQDGPLINNNLIMILIDTHEARPMCQSTSYVTSLIFTAS